MAKNTFKDEVLMAERLGAVQAQNEHLIQELKRAKASLASKKLGFISVWTILMLIMASVTAWPIYKAITAEGTPNGCYVSRTYDRESRAAFLWYSIDWRDDVQVGIYNSPELAVAAARDVFHCRLLGE